MARRRRAPAPPPAACQAPGAAPPREPAAPASATTIDGLDADTTGEVLLRLPSSASLARAVLACRRWGRVASDTGFLARFRDRHPSSPFMGVFVSDEGHESSARPLFHPACSDVPGCDIEAHRDIAAVTRKGDFALTRLDNEHRWRLRDCRNGVLLLSRDHDNSLWVYNPLSGGQPVPIQPCPDDAVNIEGEFLAICLLDGTVHQSGQRLAVDCFRVVFVQQHRHSREIQAVVYDSGTLEWQRHPWVSPWPWVNGIRKLPKQGMMPMYAASRIFWKYDNAWLLVLDTRTMGFSSCPLPYQTVYQGYSIGEIKDGKCCLVCLQGLLGSPANPRLQVWELDVDNALEVELEFKLKEEVPMSQVLDKPYSTRVCDVCTVTNGLAVLTYHRGPHFVVDLQKMSQLAKFQFRAGSGYPYQMPWPPTNTSVNTTKTVEVENSKSHLNSAQHDLSEKASLDLDGDSARIQPVEMYPSHELTQQTSAVIPSLSCNGDIQIDKSETDNLQDNTREGAEMSEPHNCDKAHPEINCANKVSETLYDVDNNNLKNNTICGGKVGAESHYFDLPLLQNKISQAGNNASAFLGKTKQFAKQHNEKSTGNQQMTANSEDHLNKCNTYKRQVNPQSEVHNLTDEEPCGQRKKLKTNATSNACPQELDQHIPSPSSCINPLVVESETIPTTAVRQYNLRARCWKSSVGQLATAHDMPLNKDASNCPQQGDPPKKSRRKEAARPKGARSTKSSHAVHDISSAEAEITAVRQTNLRATCRNSSMGNPATQEKPLCKGNYLLHTCSCTGCGEKFTRIDNVERHVKSQHRRSTIRFMCQIEGCTKVFFVKNKRKIHENSSEHVKDGTGRYKCNFEGCLSTFKKISKLNRHFMEGHKQGEWFSCGNCNRIFFRKEYLNNHLERIHKSRKTPLMCRFKGCNRKFPRKDEMETHEESSAHVEPRTLGTGKIKCQIKSCLATFATRGSHNRHYRTFHEKTSASHGGSGKPRKEKT